MSSLGQGHVEPWGRPHGAALSSPSEGGMEEAAGGGGGGGSVEVRAACGPAQTKSAVRGGGSSAEDDGRAAVEDGHFGRMVDALVEGVSDVDGLLHMEANIPIARSRLAALRTLCSSIKVGAAASCGRCLVRLWPSLHVLGLTCRGSNDRTLAREPVRDRGPRPTPSPPSERLSLPPHLAPPPRLCRSACPYPLTSPHPRASAHPLSSVASPHPLASVGAPAPRVLRGA